jgi:hypothetical protein
MHLRGNAPEADSGTAPDEEGDQRHRENENERVADHDELVRPCLLVGRSRGDRMCRRGALLTAADYEDG